MRQLGLLPEQDATRPLEMARLRELTREQATIEAMRRGECEECGKVFRLWLRELHEPGATPEREGRLELARNLPYGWLRPARSAHVHRVDYSGLFCRLQCAAAWGARQARSVKRETKSLQ